MCFANTQTTEAANINETTATHDGGTDKKITTQTDKNGRKHVTVKDKNGRIVYED